MSEFCHSDVHEKVGYEQKNVNLVSLGCCVNVACECSSGQIISIQSKFYKYYIRIVKLTQVGKNQNKFFSGRYVFMQKEKLGCKTYGMEKWKKC